jgi:MraZ protein
MIKFGGEYISSIDEKGRTSIPAKLREVFDGVYGDERFVVTKNYNRLDDGDGCRGLQIFPLAEFRKVQENLERGDTGLTAVQLNGYRRLILAPAVECTADKQGRVLIPPTLRSYASLEKEAVFVGVANRIEVWSQEAWDKVCGQDEKVFADTQSLVNLGF